MLEDRPSIHAPEVTQLILTGCLDLAIFGKHLTAATNRALQVTNEAQTVEGEAQRCLRRVEDSDS